MSRSEPEIIRYDETARNVLGSELKPCSVDPVTGSIEQGLSSPPKTLRAPSS